MIMMNKHELSIAIFYNSIDLGLLTTPITRILIEDCDEDKEIIE